MKKLLLSFLLAVTCTVTRGGQPALVHSICISNALSSADPTFLRPLIDTEVPPSRTNDFSCQDMDYTGLGGPENFTVGYQQFEFNLTNCSTFPTPLTLTLCDSGSCSAVTDTNLDTIMFLYRTPDGNNASLTNGT